MRHGSACAVLANINRDPKTTPTPYKPDDFIHWTPAEETPEPVQLLDPIAQSDLIRATLFGIAPKPK